MASTNIRDPMIAEELQCERKPENDHEVYAVSVVKQSQIVGHVYQGHVQYLSEMEERSNAQQPEAKDIADVRIWNKVEWRFCVLFILLSHIFASLVINIEQTSCLLYSNPNGTMLLAMMAILL